MAKMDKKAPAATAKKGGGWFGVIFGLALVAVFMLPTAVLIMAGMLPTLVMAITDPASDRRGAVAVGVLNFAGVLPFLIDLWQRAPLPAQFGLRSLDVSIGILMQPVTWLVMLGAAAAGSVIYLYVPRMVGLFAGLRAQSEIARRRALQKRLEGEWGEAVTNDREEKTL